MANISRYISKIKTAIYGKDVRGSLADGLDAVNKETEAATALAQETEQRQTSIEKQFDDQIANMTLDDPSSAELVAARTNVNTGKSYDTIGRRLDAEHADVTKRLQFVTYKQFGAILDGVTDDTQAIKACHVYANEHGIPVIQHGGKIYITDTIPVKTSTDLTGCDLILNNAIQNGKTLYSIQSDADTITISEFQQSELKMGANLFPSLAAYKNHYVMIDSNSLACIRNNNGVQQKIYKKDSLVLNSRDGLSTVPLIHDFTTGVLTVTAKPIDKTRLEFKGLNILWNFNNYQYGTNVIDITRSNVALKNITFHIMNDSDYNDLTASGVSLISVQYCTNVDIDNVTAENIREGISGYAYIFYIERVVNLNVNNCNLLNGWHSFGTNGVKVWNIRDSFVNGLDVHIGAGDITLDNVTFIGKWGLNIGYGDGRVIFNNCVTRVTASDVDKNVNAIVQLTPGYGLKYKGEIHINNHKIYNATYGFSLLKDPYDSNDYKPVYNIELPSLYVNNIEFKEHVPTRFYGYQFVSFSSIQATLANNSKTIKLPKNIQIENVFFETIGDDSEFRSIDFSYGVGDNMNILADTLVKLKNIKVGLCKGFSDGFATAYKQTTLISFISLITHANFNITLKVDDCSGVIVFRGLSQRVIINDSDVQYDLVNGSDLTNTCQHLRINNSYLYYYGAIGQTRAQVVNLIMIDCVINPYNLSGTYQPWIEINNTNSPIKRLHGNVFLDKTISDDIANKYWNYVNEDVYKLPTAL